MKKNGMSWLKKISIIGGAILGFGIILTSVTKVSVYIEAPKNIEVNAEDIQTLQDIYEKQQMFFNRFKNVSLSPGGINDHDYGNLIEILTELNSYTIMADVGCWTGTSTVVLATKAKEDNDKA